MSMFINEVFLGHSCYLKPGFTSWCVSIDTNKPRSREVRIYYYWQQVRRTHNCFPKQCHLPELQNWGSFKLRVHASSQVALAVKNPLASAGDPGLILGLGRFPEGGRSNPLQCSCLENPMDRGAWRATVHGVGKSQTLLSDSAHMGVCAHTHTHTHAHERLLRRALGERVHIQERIWERRIQHRIGAKVDSVQALVDWSQEGQHHHPISSGRGPSVQSVQLLSHVWLFATPWTAARQASLSITNSRTQTHVHTVDDAIQASHPLLSPSPPDFSLSQHQGL